VAADTADVPNVCSWTGRQLTEAAAVPLSIYPIRMGMSYRRTETTPRQPPERSTQRSHGNVTATRADKRVKDHAYQDKATQPVNFAEMASIFEHAALACYTVDSREGHTSFLVSGSHPVPLKASFQRNAPFPWWHRDMNVACGTEDIREANPPTDIGFRLASLSVVNNSPLIYIFVHPSLQHIFTYKGWGR